MTLQNWAENTQQIFDDYLMQAADMNYELFTRLNQGSRCPDPDGRNSVYSGPASKMVHRML